jgi:hypothetical protein
MRRDMLLLESTAYFGSCAYCVFCIAPCSEGLMLCDVSSSGWPVLFCNAAWSRITGQAVQQPGGGDSFWSSFQVGLRRLR